MTRPVFSRAELNHARDNTLGAYERGAEGWDRHRTRNLAERPWLDRFLDHVPDEGTVLDLGCGAGDPIAGYLLAANRSVVGIDFSEPMLQLARARYPQAEFRRGDLRDFSLDGTFHGALSWDGSFHLSIAEQRRLIAKLAEHLEPGAPLMMTIGDEHGETIGHVEGEPIYHASLSLDEYREHLSATGFANIDIVVEARPIDRIVLFARRQ